MAVLTMMSCSDQDPFTAATPDDAPRFLAPSSITDNVDGSMEIFRNEPFQMDVVVVPVDYTSVKWYCNGELFAEGQSVAKQFVIGTYQIKIDATTTAGKNTYRNITLVVKPLPTDPALTDLYINKVIVPGKTVTLTGQNLAKVKKIKLGDTEVAVTNATDETIEIAAPASLADGTYDAVIVDEDGEYIIGQMVVSSAANISGAKFASSPAKEFTFHGVNLQDVTAVKIGGANAEIKNKSFDELTIVVPTLGEGDYDVIVEAAKGVLFDGNRTAIFTISKEGESILFEGAKEINWGDSNIALNCEKEGIKVGSTVRIFYDIADMPDGYHCARLATGPGWAGDVLPQFDLPSTPSSSYEVEITDDIMKAINADGGEILVVGYGYKVTKIVLINPRTVWEGAKEINWGDSNIALNCAELGIKVGSKVTVEYAIADMPDGYHCARMATGPGWAGDVLPQFDLPGDPTGTFGVVITDKIMDAINGDGGEILVVGYGYKATKVTVK